MDVPSKMNLGYSLKNIPIPSIKEYKKALIEKVEHLVKRMRWKALFYLSDETPDDHSKKENFGLKSRKCPPKIDELRPFEDDMYRMIETLEFRHATNDLQAQMKMDLESIKASGEVIVNADKTRNLYKMPKESYRKLVHDNVTKNYKLAPHNTYDEINSEAKEVAGQFGVDERMDVLAKTEAFISLKDHKEGFNSKLPCRLINPAKTEIGVISKSILDGIVARLRGLGTLNMWKNSSSVIDWFTAIANKDNHTFVIFDIVDFYPSITEDLLTKALSFAKQHVDISQKDQDVIFHARKSLLFSDGRTWMKKGDSGTFDVTMGSLDGAETCELVGAYILNLLKPVFGSQSVGLYRDDGLAILKDATGHDADKLRKSVIQVFKNLGLKVTIEVNRKTVDFLDITLCLANGRYQPFRKPNDTPLYVNTMSNHPPAVIKNIPKGVGIRLSSISSDREVFDNATPVYANALAESGYPKEVPYITRDEDTENSSKKKKQRRRNIIWFNPPYSMNVKTNIGGRFLKLISKHFPKGCKLHKIFNKNTLKLSYSCTPNLSARIKGHNKSILQPKEPTKPCNCRNKKECPLHGQCQATDVVYEATLTTSNGEVKLYTGMSAPPFKSRYSNHMTSIRSVKYEKSTELSKHVWKVKKNKEDVAIEWKIKERAKSYSNSSKKCKLCIAEKYHISCADKQLSLNRRSELVSKCPHERKYYLSNFTGIT